MRKGITIAVGTAVAGLVFSFVLGCASILHGTKQDVKIISSPEQADVVIKTTLGGVEVFSGKTPAQERLKRGQEYDVTVTLAGYKESTVHISKEFDALYLGNILCGGLVGLIIDAANGAMYKLEPNTISVTLVSAYHKDNTKEAYMVFRMFNDKGDLRSFVVPLIKS